MLTDRYGLPLSTGSAAARDAYVEAADLALTFYPGAAEAYDRAIAADAGFAMAHAGKAQMLAREGDVAAARAALAAAKGFVSGLSEREASHIAFFDLTFAGRTDDAIAALYPHLTAWPRDALVVSTAANPGKKYDWVDIAHPNFSDCLHMQLHPGWPSPSTDPPRSSSINSTRT